MGNKKIILKYLLIFCFSTGILLFSIIQTPWAKNLVKQRLITWSVSQGITLTIDELEGCLPFEWQLHNVRFSKNESPPIECEKLLIRLKILSFLIGKIECSHLRVHKGKFLSIPFEGRASFTKSRIHHLCLESDHFALSGSATMENHTQLSTAIFDFTCSDLSAFIPTAITGSCTGTLKLDSEQLCMEASSESLRLANFPLDSTTLILRAKPEQENWQGTIDLTSSHEKVPLSCHVAFRTLCDFTFISVDEALFSAPDTTISSKFTYAPLVKEWEGTLLASCDNLKVWRSFFPQSSLSGNLQFSLARTDQKLTSCLQIENVHCFQLAANRLTLKVEAEGEKGNLFITGEEGSWNELSIAKIEIASTLLGQEADFTLRGQGSYQGATELVSSGHISFNPENCKFQITSLEGFALEKEFDLKEPFSIEWTPSHFTLYPLHVRVGSGTLMAQIHSGEEQLHIQAKANECPLDFFSLIFPSLTVNGVGNASIDLHGNRETLQGACYLLVDSAEVLPYGASLPLHIKGSLQLNIDQQIAQIHALARSEKEQFFDLTASVPICYKAFPFHLSIDKLRPFSSILTAEVDLEELLHFVNIGPQHLEGRLSTRLLCNNQGLNGEIELKEGRYENYISGGILKDLSMKGVAHQQSIIINSLTASDGSKEGQLTGRGHIELFPKFAFVLEGDLTHFQAVNNQTIKGNVDGHIKISGNNKEAIAKGELELVEAHFSIPDRLPPQLPDLHVTFINPPDTLVQREPDPPFFLFDLELNAPKQIFVEGRGLNCECKGKLRVSGTSTSIDASGTLSLLKGEYFFCGKLFTLTDAELIFKEKVTPGIFVTVTGNCNLPDLTARVTLCGPLFCPSLNLYSIPQLPANQILARLLFDKDVSDISPIQALQLAQTLLSLSGSAGPSDLFEKVRKTLHIDRLSLLTSEDDPGKVSLQISKYLAPGVLLTLIQGASSRNLAIEIELLRGFLLQAAINEKQQGKFSLKWHHHY